MVLAAIFPAGFAIAADLPPALAPIRIARPRYQTMQPGPFSLLMNAAAKPECFDAFGNPTVCDGATMLQVAYFGGKVVPNAKVYAVFWTATVNSTTQGSIGGFYQAITNSAWMDWLTEYSTAGIVGGSNQVIGRGTYAGAFTIAPGSSTHTCVKDSNGHFPPPGTNCIWDTDIPAELDAQINAGSLPMPDQHTIYMFHFPPTYVIQSFDRTFKSDSCVQYCAFHGTYTSTVFGSVYYSVLPDLGSNGCQFGCGSGAVFDNLCSAASHELGETMTDAEVGLANAFGPPLGWYDGAPISQGEIGDMCNQATDTLTGTAYIVQDLFSKMIWDAAPQPGTLACVSTRFATNDYTVYFNPNTKSLAAGGTASLPIHLETTHGTNSTVTLSVSSLSSLPTGVHASPSQTSVTSVPLGGAAVANLSITIDPGTAAATDRVVVLSATSGSMVHSASVLLQVVPSVAADLSLTASAASPTVLTGNAAAFTYTITNNGPDPASNVSVATSLTGFAGLTYSSPVASAGVFNPATGLWTIAGLAVGNSATLHFNVTAPNAIGTLGTNGTASSDISDPVTTNNAASASVQVLSPATLSATMAHGGSTTPGFTTTYTVAIHNSGSHDQQDNLGDEFTLVAPSQVSVTAATASSGTASFAVNTVHWNGVVAAGGTVTITISATIGSVPFGTVISAQGSVFFDADGNGTNESTAFTDDPATAAAGDATSFTVTPLPLGASTASMTYSTLSQPCRVIDTRLGGGALAGGTSRNFRVVGATGFTPQGGNSSGCGVPAGAAAAVINFVAVSPAGAGNLRGSAFPNAVPSIGSVINYAQETPALNVANGIIFPVCDPSVNDCSIADITLLANGSATDVVADVLGYFMRFPIEQIRTFAVTNATGGRTTIGTSCTNLATITVNAPATGSVVVHANVAISVPHANGTSDSVLASINTAPTVCQDATVLGESAQSNIDATEPTATYKPLLEIQRSFLASVGSVTYYINALKTAGSSSQTLQNAGVVATFHPN